MVLFLSFPNKTKTIASESSSLVSFLCQMVLFAGSLFFLESILVEGFVSTPQRFLLLEEKQSCWDISSHRPTNKACSFHSLNKWRLLSEPCWRHHVVLAWCPRWCVGPRGMKKEQDKHTMHHPCIRRNSCSLCGCWETDKEWRSQDEDAA